MEVLARMFGNLWTTVLGIAAAMAYYLNATGAKMPETRAEWGHLLFSALIAALAAAAKDATTGSSPGQTRQENELWPPVGPLPPPPALPAQPTSWEPSRLKEGRGDAPLGQRP